MLFVKLLCIWFLALSLCFCVEEVFDYLENKKIEKWSIKDMKW